MYKLYEFSCGFGLKRCRLLKLTLVTLLSQDLREKIDNLAEQVKKYKKQLKLYAKKLKDMGGKSCRPSISHHTVSVAVSTGDGKST